MLPDGALVQELDHLIRREPFRRALFLNRGAEVEQPDEALILGHADGGAALRGAEDLGCSPIGRKPPAVGGEQDDVGGAGGGV